LLSIFAFGCKALQDIKLYLVPNISRPELAVLNGIILPEIIVGKRRRGSHIHTQHIPGCAVYGLKKLFLA
jgi:hypothetical protein